MGNIIPRLKDLLEDLLDLPRGIKRLIMVVADAVMIPFALWSAFYLRLGVPFSDRLLGGWVFLTLPLVTIPILAHLGLYRAVVRFMGGQAAMAVLKGVTLSTLILATMVVLSGKTGVPRSISIIYWGVALLYIGGSRYLMYAYFYTLHTSRNTSKKVLIYGAGASGIQLVKALKSGHDCIPVAFLDDDQKKHNSIIHGLKVYSPRKMSGLMEKLDFQDVLLAMPSLSRADRRAIIEQLENLPVHVMTIPGMQDLISGKAGIDDIREVAIEELLGRDVIQPNKALLDACIRDKVVLVTGAGGSIGSELCRQALDLQPKQLLLMEISEYHLYKIDRELREISADSDATTSIIPLLGSVADRKRLEGIFKAFQIDTVYHAAAYKHVPMVEHNPQVGILNNTFGTLRTAEAARRAEVEHFILVSTDKAVNPTNVMGASKRMAEMILQAMNATGVKTIFSMVRFGNVLGSSGSVVPLFREQIREGGPVTVTHSEITRYFMTIKEAVQLVIQAGAMAEGGEVFVLDMGDPVKILDLAKHMIRLSGLEVRDEENPDGDIEIEFIGLRPGEKLYEELLIGNNVTGTDHPKIMRAEEEMLPWDDISIWLDKVRQAMEVSDLPTIRTLLRQAAKGYIPHEVIEDHTWNASLTAKEKAIH